jgi:hypothetical protein
LIIAAIAAIALRIGRFFGQAKARQSNSGRAHAAGTFGAADVARPAELLGRSIKRSRAGVSANVVPAAAKNGRSTKPDRRRKISAPDEILMTARYPSPLILLDNSIHKNSS